jgi:hypothetical protein
MRPVPATVECQARPRPPTWTTILLLLPACVGTVLARPGASTAGRIVVRYCGDGKASVSQAPAVPETDPRTAGPPRGAPPAARMASCGTAGVRSLTALLDRVPNDEPTISGAAETRHPGDPDRPLTAKKRIAKDRIGSNFTSSKSGCDRTAG